MSSDRPIRLVLVGRRDAVGWCAPAGSQDGLEAEWLEPDEELSHVVADLVVCLEPGRTDAAALAVARAPVIGWFGLGDEPTTSSEPFARVIVTGASPPGVSPWRSQPPPVSDPLYAPVGRSRADEARVVALGRATRYQDDVLDHLGPLERHEVLTPAQPADVVCVVHAHPQARAFPAALPVALASGALVISEPLAPTYGLEPGIDFLQATSAAELGAHLDLARRAPDAVGRVRHRGRAKAEALRASRVWPALVGDLLRDLAVFG